jgi:type II secretory pathway component PulF
VGFETGVRRRDMMKIDNQTLSHFADGMARCLASGLPPARALELSQFDRRSKALSELIRVARQRCDQGMAVSEALEPGRKYLPHYFIPVIRAGEAGGRLVEAFQLLHQHCRRVAPSVRLVRNTWLYPLILVTSGWVVRIGIFLYFGRTAAAWHFFWSSFGIGSLLALAMGLLLKLPAAKDFLDSLLLQFPVIREAELGLGTVLFFSTFRLAYEAGGLAVVTMFDLASDTIRNSAMRRDWARARPVLEEHGTIADAFGRLTLLEDPHKGLIATGADSGKLDQTLTQLVNSVTMQLEFTLQSFNNIFQRVVTFCLAMSIVETLTICIIL